MSTRDTLRDTPIEHDCFGDEVAIDFRSLAAVVGRMRAAFFADEEDPRSPRPRVPQPARRLDGRPDP